MAMTTLAVAGWTHLRVPVLLSPASQLWVEGKSTVRDWKCNADTMKGSIESQSDDVAARVLTGEKSITSVELIIPIGRLNCGSETMNGHMQKALKAKDQPDITFRLSSYELASADSGKRGTLNGVLTLGGVDKSIVLTVDLVRGAEGGLRVRGTHNLMMTEYGLKPPSLMLGTMKVRDQVTVGFDLLLDR
jgi:polyisoprenoid-binding protein YceI